MSAVHCLGGQICTINSRHCQVHDLAMENYRALVRFQRPSLLLFFLVANLNNGNERKGPQMTDAHSLGSQICHVNLCV